MTKMMFRITDDIREKVVKYRALGEPFTHVITQIMDEHAVGLEADIDKHGKESTRRMLQNRLDSCNPTSERFAAKKWGSFYKIHVRAAQAITEQQTRDYFAKKFERTKAAHDKIDAKIEEIESLMNEALAESDLVPKTVAEFATLHRNLIRYLILKDNLDTSVANTTTTLKNNQGDKF